MGGVKKLSERREENFRLNGCAVPALPLWGRVARSAGWGINCPPLSPYGDISPRSGGDKDASAARIEKFFKGA